jgi:hypothetical protein
VNSVLIECYEEYLRLLNKQEDAIKNGKINAFYKYFVEIDKLQNKIGSIDILVKTEDRPYELTMINRENNQKTQDTTVLRKLVIRCIKKNENNKELLENLIKKNRNEIIGLYKLKKAATAYKTKIRSGARLIDQNA